MGFLFTAIACFIGGLIVGWAVMSVQATWALGRVVERKYQEIRLLQDEVCDLRDALRAHRRRGLEEHDRAV